MRSDRGCNRWFRPCSIGPMSPAGWSWRSRKLRHCPTSKSSARFVDALRRVGCRVALDDFGAGHTSWRHLETLSVDTVKIDGSFVRNLADSHERRILLRDCSDGLALSAALPWPKGWRTPRTRRSRGPKGSAICRVTISGRRPSSALGSLSRRPVSQMAGGDAQIMEGERQLKPWSGAWHPGKSSDLEPRDCRRQSENRGCDGRSSVMAGACALHKGTQVSLDFPVPTPTGRGAGPGEGRFFDGSPA